MTFDASACDIFPRRVPDVPTETFEFRPDAGTRTLGDFHYCLDVSTRGVPAAYEYVKTVDVFDADGETVESYDGRALHVLSLMDRLRPRERNHAETESRRRLLVCPLRVSSAKGEYVRVTLDAAFVRENLSGHWMKMMTRREDGRRCPAIPLSDAAAAVTRKFSYSLGVSEAAKKSSTSFRTHDQKTHGCVPPTVVDVPLSHFDADDDDLSIRDIIVTVSRSGAAAAAPRLLSMRLHGGVDGGKGIRMDGVFASRIAPPELYGVPPTTEDDRDDDVLYFYPAAAAARRGLSLRRPFLRVKLAPVEDLPEDDEVTVHVLATATGGTKKEKKTIDVSAAVADAQRLIAMENQIAIARRRPEKEPSIIFSDTAGGEDDAIYDALLRVLCTVGCIVFVFWVLPTLFEHAERLMERHFTALILAV